MATNGLATNGLRLPRSEHYLRFLDQLDHGFFCRETRAQTRRNTEAEYVYCDNLWQIYFHLLDHLTRSHMDHMASTDRDLLEHSQVCHTAINDLTLIPDPHWSTLILTDPHCLMLGSQIQFLSPSVVECKSTPRIQIAYETAAIKYN